MKCTFQRGVAEVDFSARGRKTIVGWGKTRRFRAKCVNISKTVGDTVKVTIITNRKLHMRFRLIPMSMTLDDLELL